MQAIKNPASMRGLRRGSQLGLSARALWMFVVLLATQQNLLVKGRREFADHFLNAANLANAASGARYRDHPILVVSV